MSIQTKTGLKGVFETGDVLVETSFINLVDTLVAEGGNSAGSTTVAGAVNIGVDTIASGSNGSFAQGTSSSATGNGGSFAQGTSIIASGEHGSFAQGYSSTATGNSDSFAQGKATTATGANGSFAIGSASWANGGNGSFAMGSGATANNAGAIQFGANVNSESYSIRVSDTVGRHSPRLLAVPPASPANGDIWIGADGHVYVCTNSVTKDLTNIV